ncbi:MAG: putative sulfate/molybdate transporter [Syntrophomonadaceae bacterium]|jgi:SulP family sulfate permease
MNYLRRYSYIGPEISGSLGDLGVFLPYVIGAITIGGMDASGVFMAFGIAYLFTAWFYRLPVPVQPMKIMGASIIIAQITAGEAAAAGILLAVTLIFLALTGLIDKCAQFIPHSIISGIQTALGISLGLLSIRYINNELWLGVVVAVLMLFLLRNRFVPVALLGLGAGTLLFFLVHPGQTWPQLVPGFYLPHLIWPSWVDFQRGFTLAYLPQLPLTLTNAVLVTTALAAELYPQSAARVTERNLCLTMGLGNMALIPLGGLAFCHGAGGLAAHYSFGGRTALTPLIIGSILILLGIFIGPQSVDLLRLIPQPVIGCLLLFSSLELISNARIPTQRTDMFCFALVVVVSVAVNAGVAVAAGLILAYLFHKQWVSI